MSTLLRPVDTEHINEPQQKTIPVEQERTVMSNKTAKPMMLPIFLVIIVLGIGTGYVLSRTAGSLFSKKQTATENTQQTQGTASAKVEVGKVYGSTDTGTFKDEATGVLLNGGVNGEGSHHIVREGGESQTVYLTSSIVDLDQFENHMVEVWGETFQAQRAGWLMDVGQVKVIELNAELPDWAKKAAEKAEKQAND